MKVECGWSNVRRVPSWQEPPPALLRLQDDTQPRLGGGGLQREPLPGKLHMGREQGHRPLPMGPGNRKVNGGRTIFRAHIGKRTYFNRISSISTLKVYIGKVTYISKSTYWKVDEKMALYKQPFVFPSQWLPISFTGDADISQAGDSQNHFIQSGRRHLAIFRPNQWVLTLHS